jgi:putative FmdB family regulatory protein
MPIYTFECSKCETVYDQFLKIGEPYDGLVCPQCGARKPKKRVTAFKTNSWASSWTAWSEGSAPRSSSRCTHPENSRQPHGTETGQIRRIEQLYRRRIPPDRVVTQDVARQLTEPSRELNARSGSS